MTLKITQGDLKPDLTLTLSDEDGPIALTAATSVTVVGYRDGAVVLNRVADTVDDQGVVTLLWQPGETDDLGRIDVEVVVVWTDGPQTFEATGAVLVERAGANDDLIVTVDELVEHMSDVTLTASQRNAAERVLRGLTRNLERKLNRRFGVRTVTETLLPARDGWAMPSRRPIVEVISIDPPDTSYVLHSSRKYLKVPGGLPVGSIVTLGNYWPQGPSVDVGGTDTEQFYNNEAPVAEVTITYRGGEAIAPDDLDDVRLAIMEKASQLMTNRHDDSKSVKGFETRDTTITAKEMRWTDDEIEDLSRLRHVVVAT